MRNMCSRNDVLKQGIIWVPRRVSSGTGADMSCLGRLDTVVDVTAVLHLMMLIDFNMTAAQQDGANTLMRV